MRLIFSLFRDNFQVQQFQRKMNGRRSQEMQLVRTAIIKEYRYFQELTRVNLEVEIFQLLDRKVNNLPLRGYFAKKLVDYMLEEYHIPETSVIRQLFPGKIPFILEVVITIQYYHNQILDGKGGVTDPDRIKQNLILSNLLKEQLYQYIDQAVPENYKSLVTDFVRKIFKYTDIGQWMEKRFNTYDFLMSDKKAQNPFSPEIEQIIDETSVRLLMEKAKELLNRNIEFDGFLELYFIRIFLVSGTFFQFTTQLLKKILVPEHLDTDFRAIEKFSAFYGIMLQLVNDNCDWMPSRFEHRTVAKNYDDAFCDLKNRNVTFPIFAYLLDNNGLIKNYLESEHTEIPEGMQNDLFFEILESGAMKKAIHFGKIVGKEALLYLNPANSNWILFEDMVKISNFNRYYYHFFEEMRNTPIKLV